MYPLLREGPQKRRAWRNGLTIASAGTRVYLSKEPSRHSFVTVVRTPGCENPSSAWAGSAGRRAAVALIPSDTWIGSTYESAIDQ